MKNIEHNAIEPVIEAVEHGEISISTANEIAKLDDYEQEKLTESGLSTVKHKDIKAINDEKKDIYIPFSEFDSEIEAVSDTNKDKKRIHISLFQKMIQWNLMKNQKKGLLMTLF